MCLVCSNCSISALDDHILEFFPELQGLIWTFGHLDEVTYPLFLIHPQLQPQHQNKNLLLYLSQLPAKMSFPVMPCFVLSFVRMEDEVYGLCLSCQLITILHKRGKILSLTGLPY